MIHFCPTCRYHSQKGSQEWCHAPQLEVPDLIFYVRQAPSECGEEAKWFNPKETPCAPPAPPTP